jgi:hypothetical protein
MVLNGAAQIQETETVPKVLIAFIAFTYVAI